MHGVTHLSTIEFAPNMRANHTLRVRTSAGSQCSQTNDAGQALPIEKKALEGIPTRSGSPTASSGNGNNSLLQVELLDTLRH